MKIGVDLDGIISLIDLPKTNFRLSYGLFILLVLFVLLAIPNRKTVKKLQKIRKNGNEIIIISARPRELTNLTKRWLRFHKIPFSELFCVGLEKGIQQRKLEIIDKEGIGKFIDNDKSMVSLLNHNSVEAMVKLD